MSGSTWSFFPVSRDKFIPYLREGKGDIAMGNLTITPQRLKEVDFSAPTARNVAEIVITGPASKPVADKRGPLRAGSVRAQVLEFLRQPGTTER